MQIMLKFSVHQYNYLVVFCYPHTCNNCQGLSVLQKVLQPRPSELLLDTKLHN